MILGAVGSVLTSLLRIHRAAAVAAMSTGTFVVSQPLNYRGGARVEPVDASGTEKAFEPATGNLARGGTRMGWGLPRPCALSLLPRVLPSSPPRVAELAWSQHGAQNVGEAPGKEGALWVRWGALGGRE